MVHFLTVTVSPDNDGMRIDRFLRSYFNTLKQSDIERLLRSKMIRLNDQKAKASTRIEADMVIRYPDFLIQKSVDNSVDNFLESGSKVAFPQEIILYEDTDLMVINKPQGLASQGGSGLKIHLDLMLETLPKRNGYRPSAIHRLDRETSGCLIIAKKRHIAAKLGAQLQDKQIEKYYIAITDHIPQNPCGVIENHLLKQKKGTIEIMHPVSSVMQGALYAKSLYCIAHDQPKINKSVLLLSPITGRTHQLRAHCLQIGTPIIGDTKYHPTPHSKETLCLHAVNINFKHPVSDKVLQIVAPLPPHMIKIADKHGLCLKKALSYENKELLKEVDIQATT